jgi:hypothetical protein
MWMSTYSRCVWRGGCLAAMTSRHINALYDGCPLCACAAGVRMTPRARVPAAWRMAPPVEVASRGACGCPHRLWSCTDSKGWSWYGGALRWCGSDAWTSHGARCPPGPWQVPLFDCAKLKIVNVKFTNCR